MTTVPKPALIGFGAAIFLTAASVTAATLHFQPSLVAGLQAVRKAATAPKTICKTIATDPSPPLNVRSSPVVAPDNVVGTVRNGTQLTVVDRNEGWLRIKQPQEGWVYENLTVTSCISAAAETQTSTPVATDDGLSVLAKANERYQAGDLEAAIALAKAIPATSVAYQPAKGAVNQWQRDWKTAETTFAEMQRAIAAKRWEDVLSKVQTFPENRFWRAKLTPIVKVAIQRQKGG
ncbi:SH3 domain-containing protein [Leptolyngbya sp. FACHB-321]|uniref:SH3 domain-containing protein n=1 Tax=Leptolyngbya sp. FACHB-321 TaxID=2692807 RepID=UPI001681D1D9|nr:SH3 domain-containing protein [Leptolyngbya sp. FACHB-321]MBD2035666.1 SH3 domain-containing protein [Leptolyngbya sp. FACHB-321]